MAGKIHPRKSIFLHTSAGTAEAEGDKFNLLINLDGTPMIGHPRTGQHWTIDWESLVKMAVEAGLCETLVEAHHAP